MTKINFGSRVGVWRTSDTWPITDVIARAREIERLGYASLFYGEAGSKEAFTLTDCSADEAYRRNKIGSCSAATCGESENRALAKGLETWRLIPF